MGAKTTYTEAKGNEICRRISEGETLRAICRDEGMPSWRTVYDWIDEFPEFAARIERAREAGAEAIAQETFDIADDARNDWMEKFDQNGQSQGYVLNGEHVQRSKLRIETRLKLLAKWHPKRYGEKIEHTGKIGLEQLVTGSSDED